jgi:plasmid rolling circle replication initiator protein Rep
VAVLDVSDYIEVLYDTREEGAKEIAWRAHRIITLRLAQAYKRLCSPKYEKIVSCASYMEFRRYADFSMRLHTANFCQTRLCPTCNWRRARKIFAHVSRIRTALNDEYRYVFLTLTVKNMGSALYNKAVNKLFAAYKTLSSRKRFKSAVRGWCRVLETTYNWVSQEFHPHFHCILAVDKSYFTSDLYITQDEWCLLWQDCLDVDYKPIVDIRVFTESEKGQGKEVAELAKYCIKSSNIMANLTKIAPYKQEIQDHIRKLTDCITDEIVSTLDYALENRRLIGYGGIFKEKHRELNLGEIDGDLVHAGDDATQAIPDYDIERYHWDIGIKQYVRYEERGEGV